MKKIALGIAALTLSASILGGCGNEDTTSKAGAETKQTAQGNVEMQKGVQFTYNGQEVTDKDLENHKKTFLNGTSEKELASMGGDEYVAQNYVLQNELLNYVGSSNDEVLKEYEKYKANTGESTRMNEGQFAMDTFVKEFVDKKLTESDVKKLYETVPKEKRTMPFNVFKSDKYLQFQVATKEGMIKPEELQKDLYKKANVQSKSMKMDKDLKTVIPL
ncbi:hypothetical protein [Priestia aryabhattai]|uniref:hypothetical protein n=1 Tax=Priestia aryabhattai TaxID=412384 RepID=UPI002E1EDDCC|nr:hypothetical protein [Priestia aryabhattai]